jgi:hypothetical protein
MDQQQPQPPAASPATPFGQAIAQPAYTAAQGFAPPPQPQLGPTPAPPPQRSPQPQQQPGEQPRLSMQKVVETLWTERQEMHSAMTGLSRQVEQLGRQVQALLTVQQPQAQAQQPQQQPSAPTQLPTPARYAPPPPQQQQQQPLAPPQGAAAPLPAVFGNSAVGWQDELGVVYDRLEAYKQAELQSGTRPTNEIRLGKIERFSGLPATGSTPSITVRDWLTQIYMLPGVPTVEAIGTYLLPPALTTWNTSFITWPGLTLKQRVLHMARSFDSTSTRSRALEELQRCTQRKTPITQFNNTSAVAQLIQP